jgi:hypothetical protein
MKIAQVAPLLESASALLFPIDWAEPFGLVELGVDALWLSTTTPSLSRSALSGKNETAMAEGKTPRASCALMIMSAQDARGPEDYEVLPNPRTTKALSRRANAAGSAGTSPSRI